MKLKKQDIISYTLNFVSFLVKYIPLNRVILFGSVASGDFDKESDIDLFIETSHSEQEINKIIELYSKSEENEKYKLSGIENEFRIKVGNLDEWKSLKRSIISNGIILYGKYKEIPENLSPYLLFAVSFEKIPRNKKIRIWRKFYGYTQKIGKKRYIMKGLVDERFGRGGFVVSADKGEELINLLKKNKINYKISEIWR